MPQQWWEQYNNTTPTRTQGGPWGTRPQGAQYGSGDLADIVRNFFIPALGRAGQRASPIEDAFNAQALNPGALFGAASTAAQGVASNLFAPGGAVSKAIGSARGKIGGQGFDTGSAEGWERGILTDATRQVADTFATQAGQLESQRFGALAGANQDAQSGIRDLLESIYTGFGGQYQLNFGAQQLANSRQKILGIL